MVATFSKYIYIYIYIYITEQKRVQKACLENNMKEKFLIRFFYLDNINIIMSWMNLLYTHKKAKK